MAGLTQKEIARTKDFTIFNVTQRCCLVHISPNSWAGTVQGMRDLRISKSFSRQKKLLREVFFSSLEQRMLMPALQLVCQFLAVEPPTSVTKAGMNADGDPKNERKLSVLGMEDDPSAEMNPHGADVMQSICHLEPPARIDPQEAEAFVRVQEAGFVERNMLSSVVEEQERIWHSTFNRYPAALCEALRHGTCLRSCRERCKCTGLLGN